MTQAYPLGRGKGLPVYWWKPPGHREAGRHARATAAGKTGTVVQTTMTSYDADGNVMTQINGLGNSTSYGYDPLNRLTGASSPTGTTSYGYDAAGNLTSVTDGNGNTTSYSYDAANRLTGTAYGSATTPYSYAAGDPINAADNSGLYVWGQCTGVSGAFDFGASAQLCTLHQTNSSLVMSVADVEESDSPAATPIESSLFTTQVVVKHDPQWGTPSLGISSGEYHSSARTIYDDQHAKGCYSLGGSAGETFSGGLDVTWNCTGADGQQFSASEMSAGVGPPGLPKAEIHGSLSLYDAVSNQISGWVSGALCWLSAYASEFAS
jgi:YD repeat-containing protein